MVIIRKKRFVESGGQAPPEIDLIDSADKLLSYAERRRISTLPLDVNAVVTSLGIDLEYGPLPDDLSGTLRMDSDTAKWKMVVNSAHHQNRQRYTIAHEIGHFCLHRYAVKEFRDRVFFRATASNQMEWEANEFAGAILMSEQNFRRLLHEGVSSVDDLAVRFGVSSLALRVRAKQLGFSGHGL